MSDASQSCLVQKLSHYVSLDKASLASLAELEREERSFKRQSEVYQGGEPNANLYVVKRGWLYSYTDLIDGRRQIVEIHHPGDIVGFPDIAFHETTTVLRAAEDACLCPFPKSALKKVFDSAPQLSALLFTLSIRNQVILIDFLRAMGRMSARERIAYLVLDMLARLRIANKSVADTFNLPLNQTEISDILGLTNVYVSRSFTALEKDGLIERNNGTVRVLQEARLAEMCDFFDRHARLDTGWFPMSNR